jgi:helicase MOV-10
MNALILAPLIVAVTRAKALLIVVGDPKVLSLDPLWRSFLNYVYLNGGWTGPDIDWDPKLPVDEKGGYDKAIRQATNLDMNEFTRRMEKSTAAQIEDDIDANDDRPWREPE